MKEILSKKDLTLRTGIFFLFGESYDSVDLNLFILSFSVCQDKTGDNYNHDDCYYKLYKYLLFI